MIAPNKHSLKLVKPLQPLAKKADKYRFRTNVKESRSLLHIGDNTTISLGRVPDPSSHSAPSADRGGYFQGRVTFIAEHFRQPGIEPTRATHFFDEASTHFENLQHFSASHDNDVIEACIDI